MQWVTDRIPMSETGSQIKATKSRILVVDDDQAICRTLQLHLQSQGHQVELAHNAEQGLHTAEALRPNLVILDIRMPGKSGLAALEDFKRICPDTHVIMITAFHDMESTIHAMQHGADDYIHKPIDIDELDSAVARLLSPARKDRVYAAPEGPVLGDDVMVGRSRAMKEIFKTIGLVASRPVNILVTGDSGTGKELVARAIHRASAVSNGPFVAINCAALVETLLESDMFGHEKGSFTGAINTQPGKFTQANNGTIFLDEIGELSPTMQAKLLRVLQEKEFTPVGAKAPLKTNARVIAATNVDLTERVQEKMFREDLYYRLRVITIHLPPIRERKEDIPDLVQVLLARINRQMSRDVRHLSVEVVQALSRYDWPGNVRELENVLAKAVALCLGDTITPDLIGDIYRDMEPADPETERPLAQWALEEVEHVHVQRVLDATGWHRGQACDVLGVSRPRLRRMIRHFGLVPPAGAPGDDEEIEAEA